MTREDILAMEPGRELDKLIANKVMRFTILEHSEDYFYQIPCPDNKLGCMVLHGKKIPYYSTDITAVWEVVEKFEIAIIPQSGAPSKMTYWVSISETPEKDEINVFAKTAPETICKAALIAVMGV